MNLTRPVIKKVFYKEKAYLEKRLPTDGEILVKLGDIIAPFDILGYTFISMQKRLWRISLSEWSLKVNDGQSLSYGDLVAQKKGLIFLKKEQIKMQFHGTVSVSIDKKNAKVEAASYPERYNLISGIDAKVAKISGKISILLETGAYIVRGVFSTGSEVIGELKMVGKRENPLLLSDLTQELSGKVVVGGAFASPEVVNKANALGVAALVIGGVPYQATKTTLPLLITEGFGRIPINKRVWDFLANRELKTAVITPSRKQLIVPSSSDSFNLGMEEAYPKELKVGDMVQVFVWPYFGHSGEVLNLSNGVLRLPSGVEDIVANIKLLTGEVIDVPISNLGILI